MSSDGNQIKNNHGELAIAQFHDKCKASKIQPFHGTTSVVLIKNG